MLLTELILELKQQGKNILADCLENMQDKTAAEYSQELWNTALSEISIEPALIRAIEKELTRCDYSTEESSRIIDSFKKYRLLQTAPHTGLHEGARLLSLHWLGTVSMPQDAYYICATFSGIPFGNDSYPGAVSVSSKHAITDLFMSNSLLIPDFVKRDQDRLRDTGDVGFHRISLVPKEYRDTLVYRSQVPEKFWDVWNQLVAPIQNLISQDLQDKKDFTKIMLKSSENSTRRALGRKQIVYLDGNEIISNYLQEVLADKDHFIYKMFFEQDMHAKIMRTWQTNTHFFYEVVSRESGETQTHAYIDSLVLKTKFGETPITPAGLIEKLKNTKLSPGIFLTFTVFSFLNGLTCLGGFKQVGYLTEYKKTWLESELLPHDITAVKTDALTTGMIIDASGHALTPIDVALGSEFNASPSMPMEELILPIAPILRGFKL